MQISRSVLVLLSMLLMLISSIADASEDQPSIYEKNGVYYLKASPTWIPISGSVFVIVPVYDDGDIIELKRSGNGWVSTAISFSQFNSISPTIKTGSTYEYADVNGDGLSDFLIDLPGEELQLQLLASSDGGYLASNVSTINNTNWLTKGGSAAEQKFSAASIASTNFNGQTSGSPSVSGGAAAYSIPIDVVPGRAGIQPDISLQYNSRSGVGVAGVGWSLNANNSISRCAATLAHDGVVGAIKFSYSSDKLCLNGQRLINVSGSYGFANTEYRFEIDNFTRVFQRTGNTDSSSTYFEVKSPDGSISYYGQTTGSKVSPSGTSKTLSWLLNKTKDVSGKNHMSYYYTNYGAGEKLLTSIKYTGDGTTDGNRKVVFVYQNKSKPRNSYLWGTLTESTKRLDYIDTFYNNSRVKRYNLSYSASRASGRDLLSNVQECGYIGGTLCKEKTSFNWSDDTPSVAFERFSFNSNVMYSSEKKIENILPRGDINGDGVRDWKGYFVNAEGKLTGTTTKSINPCHTNLYKRVVVCAEGDFNKDGLTDDWRNHNGTLQLKHSSNTNGSSWFSTGISLAKKNTFYSNFQDDHIMNIADYNGDGWPDLMVYRFEDYENAKLWFYSHTGNVSSPYSAQPKLVYTFQSTGRVSRPSEIRPLTSVQFMGDMDGDSTPDLLIAKHSTNSKYSIEYPQPQPLGFLYNSGNGYSYTTSSFSYVASGSSWGAKTFFTYFTDINGDGLQDWIGWKENPDSDTESLLVAKLNKGNRLFGEEQLIQGDNLATKYSFVFFPGGGDAEFTAPKYGQAIKVADIDGDGIAELLEPGQRLVTGCMEVTDHNGRIQRRCGDSIYGAYRTSSESVAHINASENDDSIYKWNAFHFSQDSNGTIRLTKKSTNYIGHGYQSAFVDSHGKGLPDLVSLHTKTWPTNSFQNTGSGTVMAAHFENYGAYYSRNKGAARGSELYLPHDLLESVSAPKGVSATWKYRPLSSDEYDRSGTNAQPYYETDFDYTEQLTGGEGEYLHFASSMYTVAEFNIDNGVGGKNKHLYRYKGAVFNTKGRGFMGFREITHENVAAKTISGVEFGQMFPTTGLVEASSVTEVGQTRPFIVTTNDWVETSAYNGTNTYKFHNARQIKREYDVNSLYSQLSATTTSIAQSDIDARGNVLKSRTVKVDEYSELEIINTASYSASNDWPHKLNWKATSTHLSPKNSSVLWGTTNTFSRSSSTKIEQWDTVHRKPKVVVSTGSSSKFSRSQCLSTSNVTPCSVVETTYNSYGLPSKQQTKGVVLKGSGNSKAVETRTVSTTYSDNGSTESAKGYFPFKSIHENGNYDLVTTAQTSPYFGGVEKITDANGLATSTKYDSLFRPTEINAPGVAKQTFNYSSPDSAKGSQHVLYMVSTSQAGMPRTKTYMDELGRSLREATEGFGSGQWSFIDKRYNALGQLTHESLPHGGTPVYTYFSGYDVIGRLTGKITPAVDSREDFTTEYTYSALKTEIETYASDGHNLSMSRSHDSNGLLMQTTDAKGGVTRYGYDSQGNPVVIEDAAGNQIVAHYDNFGRKLWVDDPNQGKTTFTYNAFSDLENELDANGDYQRYDYDLLGRVKQRYSSDGNATFTWDTRKRGLLSKTSASGVSKEFYFDNLARPSEVRTSIDGTVYSTKTAYNASHGFVKSITYPNGLKVAMDYNSRGYLTTEKNAASGYVYRKINEQDSLGNIKKASIANNKQQGEYLYSQRTGQMLMSLVTANGSNVHYLDYDNYDSYGNLRSQVNRAVSSPQRDTYSYDNLQRLTRSAISVGNTTTYIDYGYDAVGNLKKKSDYSTNSNSAYLYQSGTNKVTSVALKAGGTATFGYDRKGNLIKRNNVTEFTYNVMNKPTVINRLGSRVSLSYDADWTRFKQVRTVDGKAITTHYIDKLYEVEQEGSNTTQTSYVSDVAVIVEGTNQKKIRFTHRDRLGSATTLMDHNNNVMAYRFYDPFGKPRMGDGSLMQSFGKSARLGNNLLDVDMSTRRGFTDHEHLDEVEIIHMNGRVYDYNLGRFLSVDPIIHGGSQGINPYSYIMNNPLSGTDPTGYAPEEEVKTKTFTVQKTGSRIKHKVTASVSSNGSGGATVTFSGSNGAAVSSVKNSVSNALSGAGYNVADIGSQGEIAKSDANAQVSPGGGGNSQDIEPFKVSTTIDRENASDIDQQGLELTERMVDMTKRAIEKSGDEDLIEEMNNTEFIYDPTHKVFEKNPDVAAFRYANEESTTIYVGRKLVDVNDPDLRFPYHGTTIRGGDTGLLFVGLHEFGHVVGRQYAKQWSSSKKERFANSFAKKHYPRRLSGTKVNRRDIKFARGDK